MDGVHVRDLRRADDAAHLQIALAAGRGADADGLVRQMHVHGIDIRLGVHGHRFDIQLFARANDAKGDFTTIGDEYFLEHERKRRAEG